MSNDLLRRQLTADVSSLGLFAVLADNASPVSASSLVLTDEDVPYTFKAADFPYFDSDGDPLQAIRVETLPALGVLSLAGAPVTSGQVISAAQIGQLVFTAPTDANGVPYTSFGFSVSDGNAASAVYTLSVAVLADNEPPVSANASVLTDEDVPYIFKASDFPTTTAMATRCRRSESRHCPRWAF